MFELKITAANATELTGILAALGGTGIALAVEEGTKAVEAVEKPRATRKPKNDEPKADPAPAAAEVAPAEPTPAPEPAAPATTYADVQKAVTTLAAKKGRDAVIDVFALFGVDHGSKLTDAQWPEAVTALTDALDA